MPRRANIGAMRAVVQRTNKASVVVDGEVVGEIGRGLCVFLGVTHDDSDADARAMAGKLVGLRIFGDDEGVMNRSVVDVGGSVLVVSQFTLYGSAVRGRRPSFTAAARPDHARPLVDLAMSEIRRAGPQVAGGRFGAHMKVELTNDGPVTIVLETVHGSFVA
jgi:D-tyrosyl-tRNA(Tyr) deacylase